MSSLEGLDVVGHKSTGQSFFGAKKNGMTVEGLPVLKARQVLRKGQGEGLKGPDPGNTGNGLVRPKIKKSALDGWEMWCLKKAGCKGGVKKAAGREKRERFG